MTRPLKIAALLLVAALLGFVSYFLVGRTSRPESPDGAARGGRLTASLRSEPARYNRYVEPTAAADLVSLLTDGRLVRINRATQAVEPALAERWVESGDGLTYTLSLRPDVRFSDGTPFTSADVLFSARALYDPAVASVLASVMRIGGQPLVFAAPDPATVTVTLPRAFEPGLRLLAHLPILPRHRLEPALDAGRFADAWRPGTPFTEITGLGPFVLTAHVAGQRLVFERNPYYWGRDDEGERLPYLDAITVLVIPDQNAEALRMGAGEIDVMSNGDIRPEDYATFTRAEADGRLRLHDVGPGLDPSLLWFNLTEATRARLPWLHDRRVRQAISYAVNRQAIADTVFLGAATPIHGPVTPGNTLWHSPEAPQYPHDPARAKALLAEAGLADRNGDGMLEDAGGQPARFSILTQAGHTLRERTTSLLQEHLRQVGLAIDIVTLDQGALRERWRRSEYDSIYYAVQTSTTDPALSLEFWLSSGSFHFWNPQQAAPATLWEAEIDDLMQRQVTASDLGDRQELFAEVQRIIGEEVPAIYFVAPHVTIAVSSRVGGLTPAPQVPQVLWNAEHLTVTGR